eukprot:1105917-Ditylum_brightwellii.AAC.1
MSARPPNAIQNKLQHSATNSVAPEQYSHRPQLIIMGTKYRPPPPHLHPHPPHKNTVQVRDNNQYVISSGKPVRLAHLGFSTS